MESGTDATQAFEFWSATSNAASSTEQPHTGPRSIKLTTTLGQVRQDNVLADAGSRISWWARFSAIPGSGTPHILGLMRATDGLGLVTIRYDVAAGVFKLFDNVTSYAGTASIQTDTWYRFSAAFTVAAATVNEFRFWINGNLDISVSNASLVSNNIGQARFGAGVSGFENCYLDDFYIDASAALTDPGDIRVAAKLPAANGTNAWDTAIGANPANRWTNVNERPISETNGWQDATAAANTLETFGLEAASAGDADLTGATIAARCAWVWAKRGSGGVGAGGDAPAIINNGTAAAVTLGTTPALFTNIVDSSSYPSDPSGIGMRANNGGADTFLYECGMLLAHTPAAAATGGSRLSLLGVGS